MTAEELLGRRYPVLADLLDVDETDLPAPNQIGDRAYVNIPEHGLSMNLDLNGRITAVQLHAEGHEGMTQFEKQLPQGLDFSLSREGLRRILGAPADSSDGGDSPILGTINAWDAFETRALRTHAQYDAQCGNVTMFTLTANTPSSTDAANSSS